MTKQTTPATPDALILQTTGKLALEQEKTHALMESLKELRKAAHAAWVFVPLGQPEHKWLKTSADAAQQLISELEGGKIEEAGG